MGKSAAIKTRVIYKTLLLYFFVMIFLIATGCSGGGGGSSSSSGSSNSTGSSSSTSSSIPSGSSSSGAYTVSGTVSGAVTSGVTIILSGADSATTTTATSGNYIFSGAANGSYTITPSQTGYTFSPASVAITVNNANITGQNFTATANVVLSSAKEITAFSLNGIAGAINEAAKTISVTMPYGTSVTALAATFTTTGASVKVGTNVQINGTTANNFTSPVIYTVTATDASTRNYIVSVTVSPIGMLRLPKTGQTICYDASGTVIACAGTGQDGELQMGVAWPNPRFTDNGDQTVTDNLTGLMWPKDAKTTPVTYNGSWLCNTSSIFDKNAILLVAGLTRSWQESVLAYMSCLNFNQYGGYNDWRLPNRKELNSLFGYGFVPLNMNFNFGAWDYMSFWSSTTNENRTNEAWGAYLTGSSEKSLAKSSVIDFYALPVRGGKSGTSGTATISLPRTGQTTCYDTSGTVINCDGTGQDGEHQMGVALPNPRFTDNGDQTVTDNLTGLMWTKDANVMKTWTTWQLALDYIKKLNQENFLGYNDWRLPNVVEMESMTYLSSSNPFNTQIINNLFDLYWTSTTWRMNTAAAWVVSLSGSSQPTQETFYSYTFQHGKTWPANVWPVRSR